MLKSNQSALQVLRGDTWQYVFCYNLDKGKTITTAARAAAVPGAALKYFTAKDGNGKYRVEHRRARR